MRALFTIICMALLLSLPIAPIAFVQDAYAQDGDGGDGGDGSDGDSGATDFGPPNKPIILDKKHYTSGDMKRLVKLYFQPNKTDIVILGAGAGYEGWVMRLAYHRPDLAAKLLNLFSKLKAGNTFGILRETKRIRKETKAALKIANKIGTSKTIISAEVADNAVKFIEVDFERRLKTEKEQRKKKK